MAIFNSKLLVYQAGYGINRPHGSRWKSPQRFDDFQFLKVHCSTYPLVLTCGSGKSTV